MRPSSSVLVTITAAVLAGLIFGTGPAVAQDAVLANGAGASAAAAGEPAAPDRDEVLRHLQTLDRKLRGQLAKAERTPATPDSQTRLLEEATRFERHLRYLRGRLQGLDAADAGLLLGKLRALDLLAENLRIAATVERPVAKDQALGERSSTPIPLKDGAPVNSLCEDALVIGDGTFTGDTSEAGSDGSSSCQACSSPDVWFRYVATVDGTVSARITDASYDTLLSVHTNCPGTTNNQIACSDDSPRDYSAVTYQASAGDELLIRVTGFCEDSGVFTLDVAPVGVIAGTVTHAVTGEPLAGATVTIRDESGYSEQSLTTDASGEYFVGVIPGTYRATAALDGFIGELYDDVVCVGGFWDCDTSRATPIVAASGTTTAGIDFALDFGGTLSGTVSDAVTGVPLREIEVRVREDGDYHEYYSSTGSSGAYAVRGLPTGTYFVATGNHSGYLNELYDGIPCPGGSGSCDPTTGTPVAVAVNSTTSGIDFALDRLGAISGTIVDVTDGRPIPYVDVDVWTAAGSRIASGHTNELGAYVTGGLPAGEYRVTTANYSGYLDELYDDLPCPEGRYGCDLWSGTAVRVDLNSTTTDIDFALTPLGAISGTVKDEVTGRALSSVEVVIYDGGGSRESSVRTDGSGRYTSAKLLPGTYFAVARPSSGYLGELYDDLPCPLVEGCDPTTGTPIEVALIETTAGVDFDLLLGGSISGTVTDEVTGRPIDSGYVEIWSETGGSVAGEYTDSRGSYTAIGLDPGRYFVTASASLHLGELYDDFPCPGDGYECDPSRGTPIEVALGTTASGIDFVLAPLGAVAGIVTNETTGQPLSDIEVVIWDSSGNSRQYGYTDSSGRYRVAGLAPGTYFASTSNYGGYLDELYDSWPCSEGGWDCLPTRGTPITVELSVTTEGIDFALSLRRGIEGVVTDEASGNPLPNVFIDVWDGNGYRARDTRTNSAGRYSVDLDEGVYFVSTDNRQGAVDEIYDDVPCPDGPASVGLCDVSPGTPIELSSSTVRRDIDFALSGLPCVSTDTAMCLNENRFRVEVVWQDPAGHTGSGHVVKLTDESSYFWFFGPGNVEIVAKVLDGCFEPFNSFWFFAAGLTNVATEITVTDTLTGETKTYDNPMGTAFQPILDTRAFSTCDAGKQRRRPAAAAGDRSATAYLDLARELETASFEPPPLLADDEKAGDCSPGPTDLCLNAGRFRLEALWRMANGTTGMGHAVALTGDTGYFWFFSPDNVEVIAKVLNACALDHGFWVFAAGLTDVEVALRVTDTVSGEVRDYVNPLGTPFQPVLDTSGFRACP